MNKRIRTKEFESTGKKLTITVLGALEGVPMAHKLAQTFIPAYKQIFASKNGEVNIIDAIESLIIGLGEIELTKVINRLFDGATVNDFPLKVDDYFAANYGELIEFMTFALSENFGSFFKTEYAKQLMQGE